MKVSDYIVSFLIERGITDVFGYPGGMVTHLMNSLDNYKDKISAHVNYNEQGSAFCACGYGQVTHKPGVAYATSGPGATNLITGIANAYFDSIPTIFITGQVNTYEMIDGLQVRQRGFQEMNIVSLVKTITKYSVQIIDETNIKHELEKTFHICMEGRPGPVLIDVPMNIFNAEINPSELQGYVFKQNIQETSVLESIEIFFKLLNLAKKPVIIVGRGVEISDCTSKFRELVNIIKIPVVTSMIARDAISGDSPYEFGFIGSYGHRYSNFIVENSDLIIAMGSRLDSRQTGVNRNIFATGAKIMRIDIDAGELGFHLREDEVCYRVDIKDFISTLLQQSIKKFDFMPWLKVCKQLREKLSGMDDQEANIMIRMLSEQLPENAMITTDVGQNQVWVAQSIFVKEQQRIFFSGGHGAMGYSLPAAIGIHYSTGKPVVSFNGDGGIQMNLQELQVVARERLPIKIFVFNNNSLGMIRHFQEMYFESNFVQTTKEKGYATPDFEKIANAYAIPYKKIKDISEIGNMSKLLREDSPAFVELCLSDTTFVFPKLAIGKPINDQDKLMNRALFMSLTAMCKLDEDAY